MDSASPIFFFRSLVFVMQTTQGHGECMLSIVSQNINIVILQIWKLIAAASMGMRSKTEGDKSIEDIA